MIDSLSYSTAFLLGLLGSAHCLGMCGGIAATIGMGSSQTRGLHLLGYNLGRIFSYSLAGLLVGSIGVLLKDAFLTILLRTFAAVMLILMGLYVAQWWKGLTKIESIGNRLWSLIRPTASKLLPVKSLPQAILLGFFWGWLPCGLIYSTLIWSSAAQNNLQSALLMMMFGLGTLPAMLTTGLMAKQVSQILKNRTTQQISGLVIILLGIYTLPFKALLGH